MATVPAPSLVSTSDEAVANIIAMHEDPFDYGQRSLSGVRDWYAVQQHGEWYFGSSRLIGYRRSELHRWLDTDDRAGEINGGTTTPHLAQWFTKLDPSDPKYSEIRAVLDEWLDGFDSSKFNSLAKLWVLKYAEPVRSADDRGRRAQITVELPTTHLFYHPILSLLDRDGRPVKRRDIVDGVADALGLSVEQRSRLANDRIPSHEYRSGWSLSVLKKAGLLANPVVGLWTLTDAARRLLLQYPSSLPLHESERINRVWWVKKDTNDIDIVAGTGQGRGLTAEQRKAVEEWAMLAAERFLRENEWSWKNTSKQEPFDYKATKAGREIIVEVKGTTGSANSILLTANEVETQRLWYPNSALIVLHSIKLDREASPPRTSGGTLLVRMDWRIDEQDLEVTAYEYMLRSD